MKIRVDVTGKQSEIMSLKKELAAILRGQSALEPPLPCPCGDNPECPIRKDCRPCPCGEDLCPGDPQDVVDDLKEQIRELNEKLNGESATKADHEIVALQCELKATREELATWKAAAANNYELYQRTVKEAGAERDRAAEEIKKYKAPEGYCWATLCWVDQQEFRKLEACRDACVGAVVHEKKNGLKRHHFNEQYQPIWDAAEPFMPGESYLE